MSHTLHPAVWSLPAQCREVESGKLLEDTIHVDRVCWETLAPHRWILTTESWLGQTLEGATMSVVTMREMLDSGVHFGHQTRRWNPKMKRFIFTERNGIYIIDLQQSLSFIDRAYEFVKETVAHGGNILFVGTKKQAQEAIAEQATRVGMPYVNHRWLGGMLTNFATVSKR